MGQQPYIERLCNFEMPGIFAMSITAIREPAYEIGEIATELYLRAYISPTSKQINIHI